MATMPMKKSPSALFDALLTQAEAEESKQFIPPRIGIIRASFDGVDVVRCVACSHSVSS